MFSMCSKLTPRACIRDNRIPQFMLPCCDTFLPFLLQLRTPEQLVCEINIATLLLVMLIVMVIMKEKIPSKLEVASHALKMWTG